MGQLWDIAERRFKDFKAQIMKFDSLVLAVMMYRTKLMGRKESGEIARI